MGRQSPRRAVSVLLAAGAAMMWLEARAGETLVAWLWFDGGAKASMTESRFVVKSEPSEEHPFANEEPPLHATPVGLLIALSGHPDFRNDLVLRVYEVAGKASDPVQLKRDLTEQSSSAYWIEWR